MLRAGISGAILKFCFQFSGHAETDDKDGRDCLADPVLNKEMDLFSSDLASVIDERTKLCSIV